MGADDAVERYLRADEIDEESDGCVDSALLHVEFGHGFADGGEEVGDGTEGVE